MRSLSKLPATHRDNLRRATEILLGFGCTAVYLFGSAARGELAPTSDLDLAIRGCPRGSFFQIFGKLMLELDCPVDLVDLDRDEAFARLLEAEGGLVPLV